MGKKKNPDRLNVTIKFTREELEQLDKLARTEYGILPYAQVVRAIIKMHIENR